MDPGRLGSRARRVSEVVALSMAAAAPWAFGSVEAWAQSLLSLGLVALGLLGLLRVVRGEPISSPGGMGWALAGLACLAVLQATPVPEGLLRAAAPGAASWRAGLLPTAPERVLGDDGPPVPLPPPTISRNPEGSWHAAAKLAGAWLLLRAGAGLGGLVTLRRFGLVTAINAAAMGLFAMIQALTWDGHIYGFRASPHRDGWSTGGPFVSHGQLADYLNLGLGFALAGLLTAGWSQRASRVGWAYLGGVLLVGLIASHSRGGVISALLATGLLVAVLRPTRLRQAFWAIVVAGVAWLIFVALGTDSPTRRLATILDPDEQGYQLRLEIWRDALGAWREQPILGCGLGTFAESAAPSLRRDHGFRVARAENETIDLLVEGGVVGLGLALAGLGALVRSVRRAWRAAGSAADRGRIAGASFGLAAVLLHSVGDFGLHIPGVSTSVVLLAGLLASAGAGPPRRPASRPRAILGGLLSLALASTILVHDGRRALAEASLAEAGLPLPGGMPKGDGPPPPSVEAGLDDPDRVERSLRAALRFRPDWGEGHLRHGLACLERYRLQAAESLRDAGPPEEAAGEDPDALADPLWLHAVVHGASPEEIESLGGLLAQEPVVASLVPAARSFLEARRCAPGLARAHAGLATLDFLLVGDTTAGTHAERALRCVGGDAATAALLAQLGVQLGDLNLAAAGWRRALAARPRDWAPAVDAAVALLDAETIAEHVLPPGDAELALRLAERVGAAAPEDERARVREVFLGKALAAAADDAWLSPGGRRRAAAAALAGLGRRDEARAAMAEALAAEPSRDDWRGELVDWLIAWGEPREARRVALLGLHYSESPDRARVAVEKAADALARASPAPPGAGRPGP